MYRVAYSERVRSELRQLIRKAASLGLAQDLINAVVLIDRILRIYPQYGEPLRDLVLEPARLMIATVPPLVVRYSLDEERKLVLVPVPFRPLPNTGLR
jgi:hypothetical protein